MGRDGLLPRSLGELDPRAEPAASIALITVLSVAFALAAGLSPTAKEAFDTVLKGTSFFLGVLFVLTAAAAARLFATDRAARWTGLVLPGSAAVVLGAILLLSLQSDDPGTRGFIAASAIIGLPLALWRGRAVRTGRALRDRTNTGSRF
jgi:amino acid transporter